MVLAIAFFASGIRQLLPTWAIVIGTNIALLSVGPIFYSGFFAYYRGSQATTDWWGWAIVALTIPAFWYWGLVESNGHYRGMVFSLAFAAIGGRTALLLGRTAWQRTRSAPTWAMAVLSATLTLWMAARFVILFVNPSSPDLRSANPTRWTTVFGFIVITSLMSMCVMWMEINRLEKKQAGGAPPAGKLSGFAGLFRNKLLLLWSSVTILVFCVASMLGVGYVNFMDAEKTRLIRTVEILNDTFVDHTLQVTSQVDTILRSVRGFYLRTHSIAETGTFTRALDFDRAVIENIFLITSEGRIIISNDTATLGTSVTDREYFKFHRTTKKDEIFISPVELGRVSGKYHFRITRRMNNHDGSFGGVVLATVNPESFARYYHGVTVGSKNLASLLGIADRKLRVRIPEPPVAQWSEPVDSPLWEALGKRPAGHYENISQVDNIRRQFVFKKVGALPLVMVVGFANDDLTYGVRERMSWLVITSLGILAFTLLLALLFTIEAKRRDEQQQAQHELQETNRRLEAATEKANGLADEAVAANKAKSEFLSSMSHEIRTPMNAIVGMADLLTESELTADQRIYAETLRNAGENLLELINGILDLSKVEAGLVVLEKTEFDLTSTLHKVCDLMSLKLKGKGISIACAPLHNIPNTLIGDPQRLMQIFINLVGNAMKFTEQGEILLGVETINGNLDLADKETVELRFYVKDTGIGIPPDKVELIFEMFTQADSSTTRKYGGTGLGLNISKHFVELMGGRIWVASEVGKGSTFFFTATFGIGKTAKTLSTKTEITSSNSDKQVAQRDLNILLVEDNEDNRLLLLYYLKKTPHHIDVAENGAIAVEKVATGKYDLVLMDVQMPVMDGYTATAEIRKLEATTGLKRTPVVALTANAMKEDEQKSREAGCDGHLTKPIRKAVLLEALEKYGNTMC